jgi:hypothetical protein
MGFALFSRLIGLTSDGVTMVQAIMAIRVLFCMCSSLQGSSLGPLLLGLNGGFQLAMFFFHPKTKLALFSQIS